MSLDNVFSAIMASIPENGTADATAQDNTSARSTSRSSVLNGAASMINRGGLGHAPNPLQQPARPQAVTPDEINAALDLYATQYLPHHPKSLSGIALRSFALGNVFLASLALTTYFLFTSNPTWRAPFFITSLSLFHFLEFYTTSKANTHSANISSFLLSSNGSAYTIAHISSFLETSLSHYFLPRPLVPASIHNLALFVGLALVIMGQGIRATAMLTAGPSFSHIVAHTKKNTHALITTGVYSIFRHPSYFGYFWWAVGTQLVCGNTVCLLGYVVVLWRFFSRRIEGEEELLVRFFGDKYVEYRKGTVVGIPFIT